MAIDDNTSYELTGYQVKDLASKVRAKADSSSLASVATSGLYSDLIGAPTIPTVYNGTLTIQHNGTTKGTFTANQSSASTVNIETIYADDYISTSPIPTTVTTAMIEDGAVTTAKIDWSTMAPTLTSQSTTGTNFNMSWKKRVYSNGEIEWFGTGQVYVQQAQHSAATVITTLPVSYDWTKMVLISNAYSDQRMFIYNAVPSGTTLTIGVGNTWTATVGGDVHVNVYIKQY